MAYTIKSNFSTSFLADRFRPRPRGATHISYYFNTIWHRQRLVTCRAEVLQTVGSRSRLRLRPPPRSGVYSRCCRGHCSVVRARIPALLARAGRTCRENSGIECFLTMNCQIAIAFQPQRHGAPYTRTPTVEIFRVTAAKRPFQRVGTQTRGLHRGCTQSI